METESRMEVTTAWVKGELFNECGVSNLQDEKFLENCFKREFI